MSLADGTRIGPYEVVGSLGAGGMGEVYRARDPRLNREVAIKVLPDLFADDRDRLARFEREAQVLAALNHPHIAHIYGVEESGRTLALVMELVEGPTLADHVTQPLAIPEVVAIARQIADALEAAHEQGIIHRDLKPANVKVRSDGTVKVLDFGLAVAPSAASSMNSPTMLQATGAGVILGTAAYMSPEQAKGKLIDRRADIWAFGVVLFEMLTGTRLFEGETMVETLGLVVTREPDLSRLPAGTPAFLRELLRRCLERDPKKRLRDIGEARIILEAPPLEAVPAPAHAAPGVLSKRRRLLWIGSLVVAAAASGLAVWQLTKPAPRHPNVRRFTIGAPENGRVMDAAVSPDGRLVAFVSGDRIWLRRLDEVDVRELQGSEGAHYLFWSPDSRFVAFEVRGQLLKADVSGGAPTTICQVPQVFSPSSGVAWFGDDRIVFTTGGSGLLEVSAQGGTPRPLLEPDRPKEIDFHDARPLPDGRGVLYVPHLQSSQNTIELFDGRTRRVVFTSKAALRDPAYAPTGELLFSQEGSVWAVPFSLAEAKTTGEPFLVASNADSPSVSVDGTLVVAPASSVSDAQLAWLERDGRVAGTVGLRGHAFSGVRLSPDGGRVAGVMATGGNLDIWILDVSTGGEMRLTFEPGADVTPAWSPDSKTIVYGCGSDICARAADGTGARDVILESARMPAVAPDGRTLVFARSGSETDLDLWMAPLSEGSPLSVAKASAKPLVALDGPQRAPVFSADGRYLSYESFTAPSWGVFVTRFPGGDGRWEVAGGVGSQGAALRWGARGDRLYYLNRAYEIVEADITTIPAFTIRSSRVLSRISLGGVTIGDAFDRSPDDTKFLVTLTNAPPGTDSRVVVIESWAAARR